MLRRRLHLPGPGRVQAPLDFAGSPALWQGSVCVCSPLVRPFLRVLPPPDVSSCCLVFACGTLVAFRGLVCASVVSFALQRIL